MVSKSLSLAGGAGVAGKRRPRGRGAGDVQTKAHDPALLSICCASWGKSPLLEPWFYLLPKGNRPILKEMLM